MKNVFKLGVRLTPLLLLLILSSVAFGQSAFPESSLVRQSCGACHKSDQAGRVEVIEQTRKSPEEWKNVVDRMIRLNSAPLDDALFYPIVKELSAKLSLTPEEMAKTAYYNSDENSQYRERPQNKMEERIYAACVRCHAYGKIISHRNTQAQWEEVRNLHLGYYPTTIPQMREMDWALESTELVKPLTEMLPFDDPKWKAWMKKRKDARLDGQWKIAGYQPGLGYYDGTYTFKAKQGLPDEYLIEREVAYANGMKIKMAGEGTLYSTYHLRYTMNPTPLTGRIEGVFDLDAAASGFKGKWWTVVQDTNAYGNEAFYKTDAKAALFASFPNALKKGKAKQTLTLVGVNLPKSVQAKDITFSDAAVSVKRVVSASQSKIVCQLNVGTGAASGPVKLTVGQVAAKNPLIIYDRVDGIKIFPSIGRARVSSGAAYPPQGVQYVARGVNYGADGKPDTADDMILEPLQVKWHLEEEKTRENDDDLKYLQTSVVNGLYTPVTTYGPIKERVQRREGIGLVAIVGATTIDGKALKSRSLVAVTVPDFIPHIK